ncbi:MAG TPA: histidine phosphatase family protein [Patescibacteria group bacterium]|nr:histidine phosphatase family protein [Patescibacteria group bacterium]
MPEIILVRHALTTQNEERTTVVGRSNHIPLSAAGRASLPEHARWFRQTDPAPTVYASPAARTVETAVGAVSYSFMDQTHSIRLHSGLQERSHGPAEGMLLEDVFTELVREQLAAAGKDARLPGGESHHEVGERMIAAVEDIARANEAETRPIVAYGHAVAITCLISELLDWDVEQTMTANVPNLSRTHIAVGARGIQLIEFAQPTMVDRK